MRIQTLIKQPPSLVTSVWGISTFVSCHVGFASPDWLIQLVQIICTLMPYRHDGKHVYLIVAMINSTPRLVLITCR